MEATPQTEDLKLVAILHALSDETRLRVVVELATSQEMTSGSCSPDVPRSSLSHHFQVLRSSGLIATRKEGRKLWNSLRRDDLDASFPGLLQSVLAAQAEQVDPSKSPPYFETPSAGRTAMEV